MVRLEKRIKWIYLYTTKKQLKILILKLDYFITNTITMFNSSIFTFSLTDILLFLMKINLMSKHNKFVKIIKTLSNV